MRTRVLSELSRRKAATTLDSAGQVRRPRQIAIPRTALFPRVTDRRNRYRRTGLNPLTTVRSQVD